MERSFEKSTAEVTAGLIQGIADELFRKSETEAAINYALGRWPALMRNCDHGLLEVDNAVPKGR